MDEQLLGSAETDEEGLFSVEYDADQFRRADGTGADLAVRVSGGRDGTVWMVRELVVNGQRVEGSTVVFNAPRDCLIEVRVDSSDEALSEYEKVMAALSPALGDVPLAELTAEDWQFLAGDTGVRTDFIAMASAAAALAARTRLPAETFYALGRHPLPQEFSRFTGTEDNEERRRLLREILGMLIATAEGELSVTLAEEVERRTVPGWLGERLDDVVRRLRRLAGAEEELAFRLLDQRTGLPLAGREAAVTWPVSAEGFTDSSGLVVFRVEQAAEGEEVREFRLRVAASEGQHPLTATMTVPERPADGPLEVRFLTPGQETLLGEDALGLPTALVETLAEHGVTTLADIRRAGGVEQIDGLDALDGNALRRLGALVDLDRLPAGPEIVSALLDGGFASVLEVAQATPQDFAKRVTAFRPEVEAAALPQIHRAAVAQVRFLDGVLTGLGSAAANGIPTEFGTALSLKDGSATAKPPGTDRCGCTDCRAAVSPAAYLADLLDYSLRTVRSGGAPVTLGFLAERLQQPLADLPAECAAVGKVERQARICIEVLRGVLGLRPLADPAHEELLAKAERTYCFAAYSLLLSGIGTSYDEVRRARVEDEDFRRRLAERLGISLTVPRPDPTTGPGDELDRLLLDPDAAPGTPGELNEPALERLFGLPDTRRDPLSDGPVLRDSGGQLVRWSLDGVAWGVSTDADGVIHAVLRELTADAYQLVLYRDPARTEPVAHGDAPTPDGVLRLDSDRGSHLTGSAWLAYHTDDPALEIRALPAVCAWRLRRLRELWAEADHPSDDYRDGHSEAPLAFLPPGFVIPPALSGRLRHASGVLSFDGPMRPDERDLLAGLSGFQDFQTAVAALYRGSQRPPVIDPDLIGPEDFRRPEPTDPAFALWTDRRELVDQWLDQLGTARRSQGLGAVLSGETGATEAEFRTLAGRLTAPASPEDLAAAKDGAADLDLTPEQCQRLAAIRETEANGGEAPADDVLAEADAILTQRRKARHFAQWRAEERAASVDLDGEWFWPALSEPEAGAWPPVGRPLIDPELVRVTDLQDLFGAVGMPVHQARFGELATMRAKLAERRSTAGFDQMLRLAVGDPLPGDPPPHDPVALLADLADPGPASVTAAQRITDDLHLTVEEFRRIMAVREGDAAGTVPRPSAADWEAVYDALLRAHKAKHLYTRWVTEEDTAGLVYWQVLRPRLPAWRAPAESRRGWQLALSARCARPIVDPDVIGPADLRTVDPQDRAFQLWQQRRSAVDGWRAAVKSAREAAPDTHAGWSAAIADPAGLAVDDSVITELAARTERGEVVQDQLDRLGLGRPGFDLVRRVGAHARSGQRITSAEWGAFDEVLAEARKQRAFAAWREEERGDHGVLLGPEYFQQADATPPDGAPLALDRWTAHRDWTSRLDGRTDQEQTAVAGLGRTVDSVEERLLPSLREGLLAAGDVDGLAPDERADRFAERYFIDARTDGCAVTTRIAQATETLQTLLWSAHTGALRQDVPPDLDALAVAAWGERQLHLLARSSDRRLWRRVFDGRWHPWILMPGPGAGLEATTGLSLAAGEAGRLELVLRGADLHAWWRPYHGRWAAWEQLDGGVAGTPVVLAPDPDTVELFALRGDAVLQRRTVRGDRSPWEEVGPEGTTSPAAVAQAGGRRDVVLGAPLPDVRRPLHRWFDGTWHQLLLDGPLEGDREPVLTSSEPGSLHLFKTESGHLMAKPFDGVWQSWTDLDASAAPGTVGLVGDPAAAVPAPGRMELFAVDGRRGLLQRSFATETGWSEWQPVPGGDLGLDAPDFDQEWPWIGTYASWRSAKFVYYNVDDYLQPMLVSRKTPAFRRLVRQTQSDTGLTPRRACELAKKYADYFEDICTLRVRATCQLNTRVRFSESCGPLAEAYRPLFYQFAVADSGRLYWTATDSGSKPGASDLIWHQVPLSADTASAARPRWSTQILGAIPYGDQAERSIALFFQVQERDGTRRLMVSRFDATLFDLPSFEWSPDGLDDAWSQAPTEIKDLPAPLSQLEIAPVANDVLPTQPAVVLHTLGDPGIHLRTVAPHNGAWDGTAGNWASYWLQPTWVSSSHPDLLLDMVRELNAAVRSDGVTWVVYRSTDDRRRAWPTGGHAFVLGGAVGDFHGALPASGGSSPGSVIYVFHEEDGVNVYRRVGNKTGAPTVHTTLTDLGPMARHSGIAAEDRLFIYRSQTSPQTTYGFRYREEATALAGSVKFADLPRVTTPRDIPLQIPDGWHASRTAALDQVFKANEGVPPSVLTPLSEAYYLVPLQLALKLQAGGHWDAALDLFRTFYDYTAPAGRRTVYPGLDASAALSPAAIQQTAADWLLDPLDPHRIAATRRGAQLRYTARAVASCLSDYADAEFTLDTAESRPRARLLYTSALSRLDIPELGSGPDECGDPLAEVLIEPGAEIPPEVLAGIGEITDRLTKAGTFLNLGGKTAYEKFTSAFAPDKAWQQMLDAAKEIAEEFLSKPPQPLTVAHAVEERTALLAHSYAELVASPATDLAAQSVGALAIGLDDVQQNVLLPPSPLPGAPMSPASGAPAVPGPLLAPAQYHFCLPPSATAMALRVHLLLNLWKLRTCRNITGVKRELDIYSAPTDTVSGRPVVGADGTIATPTGPTVRPTPYRYSTLIERARHLAKLAGQLESQMLAALEQRDRGAYDMLRARQDLAMAQADVQLQALRLTEAQSEVGLAQLQRERALQQQEHYAKLLAEPISRTEQAAVNYLLNAARYASISQDLYIWSAAIQGVAVGVPILGAAGSGFLAGSVAGGPLGGLVSALGSAAGAALAQAGPISQLLQTAASAYSSRASQYSTLSSVQSALASYERRAQDWAIQEQLAGMDVRIGDQNITIANDQFRVAQQEGATSKLAADNAGATAEFLSNKFTRTELYDWMSSVLEGLYHSFLRQATATAAMAARQLAFERQEPLSTAIKADYWTRNADGSAAGGDRKGLTGTARLVQDIEELDQHAFLTRRRKLQLSTTVSLSRLAPAEFQLFRESGEMDFETPMELFDHDFPGHYLRLLQRVRVSVIALVPPTQGIHATLASTGISRVVTGPEPFQTTTIRRDPEEVALTSPTDAAGLFDLQPQNQDELLLPFEGNGLDATWHFSMPKAANAIDYRTMADILVTYDYTALPSFDYRTQVIRSLPTDLHAQRGFSLRNDFPDAWYDLHNPELLAEDRRMAVQLRTAREDFRPNLDSLRIDSVLLHIAGVDPADKELADVSLSFQDTIATTPVGGKASTIDGTISTRQGNAGAWLPIIGKSPLGSWELRLPTTEQTTERFKAGRIEDLLIVISYSGTLPHWSH